MAGQLHCDLTGRAKAWVSARATRAGCHGATEVFLADGYVADAVVIASLQDRFWLATGGGGREITRDQQVLSDTQLQAETELLSEYEIVLPNPREGGHLIPERLVIVFETKVSRSDFLSTFQESREGNRRTPIGNLHYLITPDGLDCTDCLPDWWGILKGSGRGLREIRPAQFCELEESRLYHAAYRVLLAGRRNPLSERT